MAQEITEATERWFRPYEAHGLVLTESNGQGIGDCPFCDGINKFYVSIANGQWDCKTCAQGGNVYSFLEKLWASMPYQTSDSDKLAANRKLLWAQTIDEWGMRKNHLTGEWVAPGYNAGRKLAQLYRYKNKLDPKTKRWSWKLLPTPGLGLAEKGDEDGETEGKLGLYMPTYSGPQPDNPCLFDPAKPIIYLCEGPWDAMALYEVLRCTKRHDGRLVETGTESASLYAEANVIAAPGCTAFLDRWVPLFAGKHVIICFDNDHPRTNVRTQHVTPGAAILGTRRVAELLVKGDEPPSKIEYLCWGADGYDPARPSGYDVRDLLSESDTLLDRINQLDILLSHIKPVPEDWAPGRTKQAARTGGTQIELKPCRKWKELQNACRKALDWTEGLDRAFSVMLACIASTESMDDQLWVKIMGPPACGKSTLCEAVSVNKKYIVAKSTFRGFMSGFKSDRAGEEDNGLIDKVKGKTLVTKDGDTILQSPNLGGILSEARDLYDGVSRTHYRNKMGKDYEDARMTWVLCGTSALRKLDSSELGARFIDCIIMEEIDPELEDRVLWRVANRVKKTVTFRSNGKKESQHPAATMEMMQLTGGYINYLRQNAQSLLAGVYVSDEVLTHCAALGKFVAYMRARPSKMQEEVTERELATRLVSQIVRLSMCLAVVLNRTSIDDEVMRRVKMCAFDTARGRVLEIVKCLYANGPKGINHSSLSLYTGETDDNLKKLMRFLRKLKVADVFRPVRKGGIQGRPLWRLTSPLQDLCQEVGLSTTIATVIDDS